MMMMMINILLATFSVRLLWGSIFHIS